MYVENKVALITGGAMGLGLIYAKELLKHGLRGVTLADINEGKGLEAIDDINREYGANRAIFIRVDVVNKQEVEDAMKKTVEVFGNFDILINNAGIMNDSVWEKQIDINIKGTVNGSILAFEEYLPKYKSGSSEPVIINISSVAGLRPVFFMPVYCATKYAVIGISKVFAEAKNYDSQKVRILTLCPGPASTTLMEDLDTRSFTSRHIDFLKAYEEKKVFQSPDDVGKSINKIIENGQNGSVWVIEDGKLFRVEVPDQRDLKILEQID